MSNRLDQEREKKLSPIRMIYAIEQLEAIGCTVVRINDTQLNVIHNGNQMKVFPYSGWFTGRSVEDGRGIKNLIKQLQK